jgi:peptidoglycan/LPS O-acetylase OafA/YrhL
MLACWVMLGHIGLQCGISPQSAPTLKWVAQFNRTPGHAVSLFMILSGFVIFFLLTKSQETWGTFLLRRFFRLYPVFILCFIAGILINPIHQYICLHVPWNNDGGIILQSQMSRHDQQFLLQNILLHVPLLHGTVSETFAPFAETAFLPPAWSISTEWQFYLIAPLLFLLCRRLSGFVVVSAIVSFCALLPLIFPDFHKSTPLHASILTQLPWFYVGMVSFFCYRKYSNLETSQVFSYKILSGLVTLLILTRSHNVYPLGVWAFFFVLIVFPERILKRTFAAPIALRVCNSRIFQYIGRISYPIYMIHWPVLLICVRLIIGVSPKIDQATAFFAAIIMVGGVTFVLSHYLHQLIEQPGIDFGKRFCQSRSWLISKNPNPENP